MNLTLFALLCVSSIWHKLYGKGISLAKFITKCDGNYYKVRQLILLQSMAAYYYKVRQVLF